MRSEIAGRSTHWYQKQHRDRPSGRFACLGCRKDQTTVAIERSIPGPRLGGSVWPFEALNFEKPLPCEFDSDK